MSAYRKLLGNSRQSGVYHLPVGAAEDISHAAQANGQAVFRIDLRDARNKDELLALLGAAMHFPDWYGHNFDALADCLTDLTWQPAEGYTVILEECDEIYAQASSDFTDTLTIFNEVVLTWREQGVPFWCFIDMLAVGKPWLPSLNLAPDTHP